MKTKQKLTILTIILIFAISLSACGNKELSTVQSIKESGKLVLGTSADYPPYEWHLIDGSKDKIVGVDIEIAKKIAQDLDVELEIKDMQFDALLPSLDNGDINIVVAGMVPNEDRIKAADFSKPYYESGQCIVVRNEDKDKYKSTEDLKGEKIGAQLGTIQHQYVEENIDAEIVAIPNNNNLLMDLKNGTLDALFMATIPAEQFQKLNSDITIINNLGIPNEDGSCIAVKKGDTEFLNEINKSVDSLNKTNQVEDWFKEYMNLADETK